MLSFDAFRAYVEENVLNALPEEYEDAVVKIEHVAKANTERYGLTVLRKGESISPNVYLESYYEDYMQGKDLAYVLTDIARDYVRAKESVPFTAEITTKYTDWDVAKSHVVFDLVGKEQNLSFNENRPNRDFLDLSIIYRIVIAKDERGMASTIVTNDMMKTLGVTEQDLYDAAFANTREIYKPRVASLNEVIGPMVDETLPECPLFFASNESGINGSSMLIFDDVLQELADRILGPFYEDGDKRELIVFPSSRHEILALDARELGEGDLEYCEQLVFDINMACVALEDRLSNNVYLYDAMTHEIKLAGEAIDKRLDGEPKDMDKAI